MHHRQGNHRHPPLMRCLPHSYRSRSHLQAHSLQACASMHQIRSPPIGPHGFTAARGSMQHCGPTPRHPVPGLCWQHHVAWTGQCPWCGRSAQEGSRPHHCHARPHLAPSTVWPDKKASMAGPLDRPRVPTVNDAKRFGIFLSDAIREPFPDVQMHLLCLVRCGHLETSHTAWHRQQVTPVCRQVFGPAVRLMLMPTSHYLAWLRSSD